MNSLATLLYVAVIIGVIICMSLPGCEGYKCDCDYHPGGCTISVPPPANMACHCVYKGWWTCGAYITSCRNPNSRYCKHPDYSRATCFQGDGDCGGY